MFSAPFDCAKHAGILPENTKLNRFDFLLVSPLRAGVCEPRRQMLAETRKSKSDSSNHFWQPPSILIYLSSFLFRRIDNFKYHSLVLLQLYVESELTTISWEMKIKVETKKQIVLKCKSVFLFGLILSHQLCDQKMTILWTFKHSLEYRWMFWYNTFKQTFECKGMIVWIMKFVK